MKVHVVSCMTGPQAKEAQYERLHRLFLSSVPRLHEWTENPDQADIIFLTNFHQPSGSILDRHPAPRKYAEKCFALSDQDGPPFPLAGIYASAPRSVFGQGRFRSGSYALHHPDFRNPFIEHYEYGTGNRPAPDLLASFLGRDCHPVRKQLLALPLPREKFLIEDTSNYNAFTHGAEGKRERQQAYFEICLRSKYILCPRGAGPASIRLFEALKLGIAPVVISDAWIPCDGPRWSDFTIFIAEKNLSTLAAVIERAEPEYAARGQLARKAYEEFFSPGSYFNFLVSAAASARQARIIPERVFVSLWPVQRLWRKASQRGRRLVGAK